MAAAARRALPKLIVFDLDACLWTPEMFELSSAPTAYSADKGGVIAGGDVVTLFPGAKAVLRRLLTDAEFSATKVAVASSTTEPKFANRCLDVLPADHTAERGERLSDLVDFRQIYVISAASNCGVRTKSPSPWRSHSRLPFRPGLYSLEAKEDNTFLLCTRRAASSTLACSFSMIAPMATTAKMWRAAAKAPLASARRKG